MAKFKKGEGGRPKGARNKRTLVGADQASIALEAMGGFNKLGVLVKQLIEKGELKDAASIILKTAEFAHPKLKAIDMTTTIEDHREDMPLKDIEAEIARLKKINDKEFETFDDD